MLCCCFGVLRGYCCGSVNAALCWQCERSFFIYQHPMGFYSRPACSCPTFQHACPPFLLSVKCDMLAPFSPTSLRYPTAEPLAEKPQWLGLHPSILFSSVKSNSLLSWKPPHWHSSIFCFSWIWAVWSGPASTSFVSVRLLSLQPTSFCTLFSLFKWPLTHKGPGDAMFKANNITVAGMGMGGRLFAVSSCSKPINRMLNWGSLP